MNCEDSCDVWWLKIANPQKYEVAVLDAVEAHAPEADARGRARIVGKDDLIGRNRDSPTVGEHDERPGRAVLNDRQLGDEWRLAIDRRIDDELDQQRNIDQRVLLSYAGSVVRRPSSTGPPTVKW